MLPPPSPSSMSSRSSKSSRFALGARETFFYPALPCMPRPGDSMSSRSSRLSSSSRPLPAAAMFLLSTKPVYLLILSGSKVFTALIGWSLCELAEVIPFLALIALLNYYWTYNLSCEELFSNPAFNSHFSRLSKALIIFDWDPHAYSCKMGLCNRVVLRLGTIQILRNQTK